MSQFRPCRDRNACTEDGVMCKGCGRTHVEIARTRAVVADLVNFIAAMQYENPEDLMDYLTRKVMKKTKVSEKAPENVI
jgi:hypothetical protein